MSNYDFTIRRAVAGDAAIISEFNLRLAAETEDLVLNPVVLIPGVEAALAPGSHAAYFVAESGGQVIGQVMITYEWSDWRNGAIWWFQSVYVHPDWRGGGVFRRLYEHVIRTGQQEGAVGFRLYVVDENTSAQEAYRRMGMKPSHYVVWEQFPDKA